MVFSGMTNCGIAHILGILLMNSYNTDIFFSNYYNLRSVHFELNIYFSFRQIFLFFVFKFRRIICTIFLCNKKYRSPCSFKRKGPSHLLRFRERKDRCVCTFNDFNTFAQLSFPSLPQISTSFSQPCLSETPTFLACEPSSKESRHYILLPITCYYAQYRMRSAILRNHLNYDQTDNHSRELSSF